MVFARPTGEAVVVEPLCSKRFKPDLDRDKMRWIRAHTWERHIEEHKFTLRDVARCFQFDEKTVREDLKFLDAERVRRGLKAKGLCPDVLSTGN